MAMRLKVEAIVSDEQLGRFSLQANQVAPFNAFVNLAQSQEKIGQTNRANLLLIPNIAKDSGFSASSILRDLAETFKMRPKLYESGAFLGRHGQLVDKSAGLQVPRYPKALGILPHVWPMHYYPTPGNLPTPNRNCAP